jgi:Na+/H+-dicarboxylate symporter
MAGMTRRHIFDIVHIVADVYVIGAFGFFLFTPKEKRQEKTRLFLATVISVFLVTLALLVFHL